MPWWPHFLAGRARNDQLANSRPPDNKLVETDPANDVTDPELLDW